MFYNALTRKGKGEGVKEHDMSGVVAIHNNMNERAWAKIAAWEKLHCEYVIWTAVAPQTVAETTQHHLLAFVLLSPLLLSRSTSECPDSRLLRFRGRPTELTPKARLKTWLG